MQNEVNEKPLYAIVAAVHLPSVSDEEFAASLTELRELAKTLGFKVTRSNQSQHDFAQTCALP